MALKNSGIILFYPFLCNFWIKDEEISGKLL